MKKKKKVSTSLFRVSASLTHSLTTHQKLEHSFQFSESNTEKPHTLPQSFISNQTKLHPFPHFPLTVVFNQALFAKVAKVLVLVAIT
ncbi:hypothetical protein ABKV19_021424 [Rosa sericea]